MMKIGQRCRTRRWDPLGTRQKCVAMEKGSDTNASNGNSESMERSTYKENQLMKVRAAAKPASLDMRMHTEDRKVD